MNEEEALAAFGALSHETRLRLLKTLVAAGPGGLRAGTLADAVAASPSRASFHLAALAGTGLVTAERHAREITYRVDFRRISGLVRFLLEDCCAGDPTARACCGPAG